MPQTTGGSLWRIGTGSYLPITRNWHGTDAGDPLNVSKRVFIPHYLRPGPLIRKKQPIRFSMLEPTRTARPSFSSLTSKWLWAIIRTSSPFFFWNLHVTDVICLQYLVAQWRLRHPESVQACVQRCFRDCGERRLHAAEGRDASHI